MPITIVSFGHLHGAPPQAHLVVDLRGHFRNPAPDLSRALADEQGLTRSRSWVLTELRRLEAAGRLWQDDDGRWSPAA